MHDAPGRVLVLDAHRNHSLYFMRSMSEKGVGVTAACRSRLGPAMLSRYADERHVHPNQHESPGRFVDHLVRYLRRNPHTAVFALADRSHTILSKHKHRIADTGTLVGVEDWERFAIANNKKSLIDIVVDEAPLVPIPDTRAPASVADVRRLRDELPYPVLLKPRFTSVKDAEGRYHEARISRRNYVYRPSELVPAFRALVDEVDYYARHPPLIQEVISGTTVATGGLAEDGELLASFQEKRIRTYPIEGGVGALRQGICEPEMLSYARRIIRALEWSGPVYVEFMMTPDGEFYLIEVNGRYWGSLGLAVNCGVDFPWYHYQQLRGAEFECEHTYATDILQRRLFYTDIRWILEKLSRGDIRALPEFIGSFLNTTDDVLRLDDPLPAVGSLLWAGRAIMEKYVSSAY